MKTLMRQRFALILSGLAMSVAGCGGLVPVPEDCVVFDRSEARSWVALALSEQADGESELDAFGTVLRECLQSNCDGQSGGVCAVSCTACADAIINLVYD